LKSGFTIRIFLGFFENLAVDDIPIRT
jgi:hypothetical protein